MESVSLKLEKAFLHDIEKAMKKHNYATKTEFIREAVRDKLKILEKQEEKEIKQVTQETKKQEPRPIPSYI